MAGALTPGPRGNVLALGADYALFMIGLSFASQSTILPAFADYLGAPNVVIGAIPAVMTAGWNLPSLFVAAHTEGLARKLPFVLRYTLWERVPFPVLALAAFFLAERAPVLTLALLLALLLVVTGVGGVLMPAWMDIVGRAIPLSQRGRFFAVSSLVASAGGFAGSFATAWVLATLPAPASYGVCFLVTTVFMALSYWALASVREPAPAASPVARPLRDHLRGVPALLRRDRSLRWYLVARAFGLASGMATGFYAVYALRAWQAPTWQLGVFTGALLGGQILGNAILGGVADRAGHRVVVIAGTAASAAASAVALAAPSLAVFSTAFVLVGVSFAAVNVSALTILLEFAPGVDEQPTYVGLGTTAVAPVAFASPLLAGLLADAVGFRSVFALSLACGLVGLPLLIARVRDPRHRARA